MTWQQEFSEALKTKNELNSFFQIDFPETNYPIFIPKNFANKILKSGVNSPLWLQFLPHPDENLTIGRYDPIGDKTYSKGNQLIHRYHNRVLFTPTTICPILCRYCFRKNELAQKDEVFNRNFDSAKEYLHLNKEINEIIFTGGDPLILSNEKIAGFLQEFSEIKSIKYIRFHSRTPIILPSRIDEGFIEVMKLASNQFSRVMLMIHVNHLDEIDDEVKTAILKLTNAGVEVYSQTVLLKGINDNTKSLEELFLALSDLKVRPYYLHHPDEALGAMHFHLSLVEGRKIVLPLHDKLPGWALPQYVIDIPGGEGKIPAINPEKFEFSGILLNRHGREISLIS